MTVISTNKRKSYVLEDLNRLGYVMGERTEPGTKTTKYRICPVWALPEDEKPVPGSHTVNYFAIPDGYPVFLGIREIERVLQGLFLERYKANKESA